MLFRTVLFFQLLSATWTVTSATSAADLENVTIFSELPAATPAIISDTATENVGGNRYCSQPCSFRNGTFCGIDGACHPTTCNNWYEFGDREYTGYDFTDTPIQLKCKPIPEKTISGLMAIKLNCGMGALTPYPEEFIQGFNQECSVTKYNGGRSSRFVCYEMNVTTDFAPFLARIKDVNSTNCPVPYVEPKKFWDWVWLEREIWSNPSFPSRTIDYWGTATEEFVGANMAPMAAGYQLYDYTSAPTLTPTLSPSFAPTTSAPTTSASNSQNMASLQIALTAAVCNVALAKRI